MGGGGGMGIKMDSIVLTHAISYITIPFTAIIPLKKFFLIDLRRRQQISTCFGCPCRIAR